MSNISQIVKNVFLSLRKNLIKLEKKASYGKAKEGWGEFDASFRYNASFSLII